MCLVVFAFVLICCCCVNSDVNFVEFLFEVVRHWGLSGSAELWSAGLNVEEDVFVKQRACFFDSSVFR